MNTFWSSAVNFITEFFSSLPFTGATWFVLAVLAFFVWLFVKANAKPNSPVQWEHLIIDSTNDRTSPYKVGYLIGLIVATWIILTLTDKAELNFDMFGLYLTYLLGGAGINSFVKRGETNYHDEYDRRNNNGEEPDEVESTYQYKNRKRQRPAGASSVDPEAAGPASYGPSVRELDEQP